MARLDGKVAIITGAASGMGRATARLFARQGARLLLADVDRTPGEAVAREIAHSGGVAMFQPADVSRSEDVQGMIQAALDAYGALDVLFNNAGIEGESATIVN